MPIPEAVQTVNDNKRSDVRQQIDCLVLRILGTCT